MHSDIQEFTRDIEDFFDQNQEAHKGFINHFITYIYNYQNQDGSQKQPPIGLVHEMYVAMETFVRTGGRFLTKSDSERAEQAFNQVINLFPGAHENMDDRKFKFLAHWDGLSEEDVNNHFIQVDNLMKGIKVGTWIKINGQNFKVKQVVDRVQGSLICERCQHHEKPELPSYLYPMHPDGDKFITTVGIFLENFLNPALEIEILS